MLRKHPYRVLPISLQQKAKHLFPLCRGSLVVIVDKFLQYGHASIRHSMRTIALISLSATGKEAEVTAFFWHNAL